VNLARFGDKFYESKNHILLNFGLPIELNTESGGLLFKKLKLSFKIWQRKTPKKTVNILQFEKTIRHLAKIPAKKQKKKQNTVITYLIFLMFLGVLGTRFFLLKFSCVASFTGSSKKDLALIGNNTLQKKKLSKQ
jgi:hypothetical protein